MRAAQTGGSVPRGLLPALALTLVLLAPLGVRGQSTDLTGTVVDSLTNEVLPNVLVALDESSFGVLTDAFGRFALVGLPAGPLSVVYKAFDNMDGFRRFLGFQPNTKVAVLTFGLFHGFGLATAIQENAPSREGLVTNMLSFNIGVEMGQILALMGVLIALSFWRTRDGFLRHAFVTNALLMAGGFTLMGYQIVGYFVNAS